MTARDPRKDPKAGDIIAKSSGTRFVRRIVVSADESDVQYRQCEGGSIWKTSPKLWRKWSSDAVVIVEAST